MEKKRMKNVLYNTILGWFDNSLEEYSGLDDKDFIKKVCEATGITESEYRETCFEEKKDCLKNGEQMQLSPKEITALKFAIDTMDKNAKRYAMTTMYCKGEKVGFGEAIAILEEMVKKAVSENMED